MKKPTANAMAAIACAGGVMFMTGAAFAAVPLYRMFCQVTGFDGTALRKLLSDLLGGAELTAPMIAAVIKKLKCAALEVFGDSVTDLLHGGTQLGAWQGVASAAAVAGHADEVVCGVPDALELLERLPSRHAKAVRLGDEPFAAEQLDVRCCEPHDQPLLVQPPEPQQHLVQLVVLLRHRRICSGDRHNPFAQRRAAGGRRAAAAAAAAR